MARPSKYTSIKLNADELDRLTTISNSRTEMIRTVQRAKILLLITEGISVKAIADKLDLNRKSVELCLNKYMESGLETALNDNSGRGRKAVIMDEDKAWVQNLACQQPSKFGYAQELWTQRKLAEHIRIHCEEAGHSVLKNASVSVVNGILNETDIKPHKIRYYLERRDPDFDEKMKDVLIVYKQIEMQLKSNEDNGIVTVSYDEKPGIQAVANVAPDMPPTKEHGFIARDSEYKRLGTVSLLAGIDLYTGEIIPLVRESHKSDDFIDFLKILDGKYDKDKNIRIVLDNHSIHTSKKTREYLAVKPERFTFVFTPKHGSWLNIIEAFFGKFARVCLRGIRVNTKQELVDRIYQYMDEVNDAPVVPRWKYRMDEITV